MLETLKDKDQKRAAAYFRQLYKQSIESEALLPYVNDLTALLAERDTHIATWAFLLLIRQFRHLDLSAYLVKLQDYVRHCGGIALREAIQGVSQEIDYSPELLALFQGIKAEDYGPSLAPLIQKDLDGLTKIRKMSSEEYCLLADYTYEAIFVEEGRPKPERAILEKPLLKLYYQDFGQGEADLAMVACVGLYVVGACWCRKIRDYGYISADIPSLAIAVNSDFRGLGLGKKLLKALFEEAGKQGYPALSLSVQRANPAFALYLSMGFRIYRETLEEIIMIKDLEAQDE